MTFLDSHNPLGAGTIPACPDSGHQAKAELTLSASKDALETEKAALAKFEPARLADTLEVEIDARLKMFANSNEDYFDSALSLNEWRFDRTAFSAFLQRGQSIRAFVEFDAIILLARLAARTAVAEEKLAIRQSAIVALNGKIAKHNRCVDAYSTGTDSVFSALKVIAQAQLADQNVPGGVFPACFRVRCKRVRAAHKATLGGLSRTDAWLKERFAREAGQ
jgi:hypothetical protein